MILVVDDDHTIVHMCRAILEKEGYEVRTASSGETAYQHVRDPRCRGMILDMLMPGINGAGLLMLMAAEGNRVPVIVLSAAPDIDEQEMKEFPNVRKLVRKPFYAEDLLGLVHEHFGRSRG